MASLGWSYIELRYYKTQPVGVPALERLDEAFVIQGALRDVVVVGEQVLGKRGVVVTGTGEAGLLDPSRRSAP